MARESDPRIVRRNSVPASPMAGRILLVEDDPIVVADLRGRLHALGYTICGVAANAVDALEAVARLEPDLVLADVGLPGGVDGISVAEEIYICHGVGVVFVSANGNRSVFERARSAGAYGWVGKPASNEALCSAIELALAKHREVRVTQSAADYHRAILANTSAAVVVTDTGGRVGFLNRAAARRSGWSAAMAIGQSVLEVFGQGGTLDPRVVREVGQRLSLGESGPWTVAIGAGLRFEVRSLAMEEGESPVHQMVWTLRETTKP